MVATSVPDLVATNYYLGLIVALYVLKFMSVTLKFFTPLLRKGIAVEPIKAVPGQMGLN